MHVFDVFRAAICEKHFLENDIIIFKMKKKLKLGARPCLYLPKQSTQFSELNHKAPLARSSLPAKPKYKSNDDLKKVAAKLGKSLQGLNDTVTFAGKN